MTIVIPEDDNVNEIVIDVRDVLRGAELEFNADKEFNLIFRNRNDIISNNFVTEFVFTIQKSDFKFQVDEGGFVPNVKKILKKLKAEILDIINDKYTKMRKLLGSDLETNYNRYNKDFDTWSTGFNRRFLRHIKEQYCNIVDSSRCQVILMRKGDKIILGEQAFDESVQLVAVSTVNSSKKLGLETPNLRNVKITELGICPVKVLTLTMDNLTKNKKGTFKYNRYIEEKMKTVEQECEL